MDYEEELVFEVEIPVTPVNSDKEVELSYKRAVTSKKGAKTLEEQIKEYQEKGGTITHLPFSPVSTLQYLPNEFTGKNQADGFKEGRDKAHAKNKKATLKSKQNPTGFKHIYKSDYDPTKFVVIYDNVVSNQFKTIQQAHSHLNYLLLSQSFMQQPEQ